MQKRNLIVIYLITLMGVASITPAFLSTIKYFGIPPTQVTMSIIFFTFPCIFLAPVTGILADKFGRKTILIPSLFLFGLLFFQL